MDTKITLETPVTKPVECSFCESGECDCVSIKHGEDNARN
jgi:hypothetical protein